MADLTATLAFVVPLAPIAVAGAVLPCRSATSADRVGRWGGLAAALPALVLAAIALARADEAPLTGSWWIVDAPAAVFLATIAFAGAS